MSVDHENGQERNEGYVLNRSFPLNNGPVINYYDVFE